MIIARCLTVLLLLSGTSAMAECVIDGATYPEGTNVNGYVCVDGKWVEE